MTNTANRLSLMLSSAVVISGAVLSLRLHVTSVSQCAEPEQLKRSVAPVQRFATKTRGIDAYWQWLKNESDVSIRDFDRFVGFLEAKVGCDIPDAWRDILHYRVASIPVNGTKRRLLSEELGDNKNGNCLFGQLTNRKDGDSRYEIASTKDGFSLTYANGRQLPLDDVISAYGDEIGDGSTWRAFQTPRGWILACPGQFPFEYSLFLLNDRDGSEGSIVWKSSVRAMYYPHSYSGVLGGSFHRVEFSLAGNDLAVFGSSSDGEYVEVFELDEGNRVVSATFR